MGDKPQKPLSIVGSEEKPLLHLKEAAKYLGVSTTQVLRLIKGKFEGPRLKHARSGKRIIIRPAAIQEWLLESERYNEEKIRRG